MGVNNLLAQLKKLYPKNFSHSYFGMYDALYIEMNPILHKVLRTKNTSQTLVLQTFLNDVKDYLESILKHFLAKRVVCIFDGFASNSKLKEQTNRKKDVLELTSAVNIAHIAPNTKTMIEVEKSVNDVLESTRALFLLHKYEFEIISSNVIGEGEIKLMNHLNTHYEIGKKMAILSVDSDLILLSILSRAQSDITIIFQAKRGSELMLDVKGLCDNIKSTLLNNIRKNPIEYLNKKRTLSNEFLAKIDDRRLLLDYSTVCLFRGNDYLPSLYGSGYLKDFDIYSQAFIYRNLCQDPNIKYLCGLDLIGNVYENSINKAFFETYIWLYQQTINDTFVLYKNVVSTLDKNLIINYIEGLNWCMNLYLNCVYTDFEYECTAKFQNGTSDSINATFICSQFSCLGLEPIIKNKKVTLNIPDESVLRKKHFSDEWIKILY